MDQSIIGNLSASIGLDYIIETWSAVFLYGKEECKPHSFYNTLFEQNGSPVKCGNIYSPWHLYSHIDEIMEFFKAPIFLFPS